MTFDVYPRAFLGFAVFIHNIPTRQVQVNNYPEFMVKLEDDNIN